MLSVYYMENIYCNKLLFYLSPEVVYLSFNTSFVFYADFNPATSSSQFGTQFTNPPSTDTSSVPQTTSESQSRTSTFSETVRHSGDYMPHSQYVMPRANPPVVVEVHVV